MLLLSACTLFQKPSASDFLHKFGIKFNENAQKDFIQTELLPTDPTSLNAFRSTNGQILRIQTFPATNLDEAKKIFQYRSRIVKALFETQVVAYRGKVTVEESCLSKNRVQSEVKQSETGIELRFDLLGTKNFVYGSCAESEDEYKSQYILLYCAKANSVLEAKLFYTKTDPDLNYSTIQCE